MNMFRLSIRNLTSKLLSSVMSLLLLTLGVSIISILLLMGRHIDNQFKRDIRGIDLVIGAKGSPLQLILSGIYHMDAPTGNISKQEADSVAKHPLVAKAIPLSYGDTYKGYRIVGTTPQYPDHYEMELEAGAVFNKTYEVTLGKSVAERLGLNVGDTFFGTHGALEGADVHDEANYTVVGIYKLSGSVLDKLILTDTRSVWDIHDHDHEESKTAELPKKTDDHEHDDDHEHEDDHQTDESNQDDTDREYTVMLIKFKNPFGLFQIPRKVNEETSMQAALPAVEVNRLISLLGIGIDGLEALAFVIILISAVSIFISLYNSIKEKKYELALMRTQGASRGKLLMLPLLESFILTGIGIIIALIISRIGMMLLLNSVEKAAVYDMTSFPFLIGEIWLIAAMIGIAVVSALIPALNAFNLDISKVLSER